MLTTTYSAHSTGGYAPPTILLPQIPPAEEPNSHREPPGWEAGYRRLLTLAAVLAAVCIMLWLIWGFTTSHQTIPLVGRVLLSWAAGIVTVSAIMAMLSAIMVRVVGQHIDRATSQGVSAAYALQGLRQEVHATATYGQMRQLLDEVAQQVCGQVAYLGQRVVTVERRVDEAEQTISEMATAANIVAQASDIGSVRHLRPDGPQPRRPRGA